MWTQTPYRKPGGELLFCELAQIKQCTDANPKQQLPGEAIVALPSLPAKNTVLE
jgi:hypothetical protein